MLDRGHRLEMCERYVTSLSEAGAELAVAQAYLRVQQAKDYEIMMRLTSTSAPTRVERGEPA
jgi:hypothetical protein